MVFKKKPKVQSPAPAQSRKDEEEADKDNKPVQKEVQIIVEDP